MNPIPQSAIRCQFCQTPITAPQARLHGGACAQSACQLRYAQQLAQQLRDERRRAVELMGRELTSKLIQCGAIAPDATPESLWILDVPVNQRPLTALPIERKQQFLDQLRAAIDTAFQERAAGTPAEEDAPCQEEPPLAQRTCAICRGGCCPNGGEHAYITPQTIHRYLTAVPGATPTEILDQYESYFGENTFEGSCVFHRELGCALPRHLRSSVCNSYACRSAGAARDIALLGPRGRPVVIVAVEHLHIVGWEILPPDQCGGERSASVPATTTEIATS